MVMEVIVKDRASYLESAITESLDLDKEDDRIHFQNIYGEAFLTYIRGLKAGGSVEVLITWRD